MLKTNENLWCYIDSNDCASECFPSKEEALDDWLANREDDDGNVVYIGHPQFYVPIVDAFAVVENIQNQACSDTYGYSEENREYLWRVNDEELHELQDMLTNAFWEWQDVYGHNEEMYIVDEKERYMLMPNGEFCCCRKQEK